jgi:ADP-ribose pyrophosphatase YjhB (NUDIX family)
MRPLPAIPPHLDASGEDVFASATDKLCPDDAVSALLLTDDGRYLCQLRDQRPDIFFPGHWGLFGGAVEPGETECQALIRELDEELALSAREMRLFTRFDFDLTTIGLGVIYRGFYEVRLAPGEEKRLTLGEGAGMAAFDGATLIGLQRVIPYDAFAIWLHVSRDRLMRGGLPERQG